MRKGKRTRYSFLVRILGPGIPDEIKDKIFDLFYTTKDGGTGIGLSFAQNIIQAHGGVVRLEQTHKGSKFVIAIPTN